MKMRERDRKREKKGKSSVAAEWNYTWKSIIENLNSGYLKTRKIAIQRISGAVMSNINSIQNLKSLKQNLNYFAKKNVLDEFFSLIFHLGQFLI